MCFLTLCTDVCLSVCVCACVCICVCVHELACIYVRVSVCVYPYRWLGSPRFILLAAGGAGPVATICVGILSFEHHM